MSLDHLTLCQEKNFIVSFLKMVKVPGFLPALVFGICSALLPLGVKAEGGPNKPSIAFTQGKVDSDAHILRVSVRGPEGIEQFIFQRRLYSEKVLSPGTKLFKGRIREHGAQLSHPRGAALDLIGDKVTLRFPGRRRRTGSRMYAVQGHLTSSTNGKIVNLVHIGRTSRSGGGTCADQALISTTASNNSSTSAPQDISVAPLQTRVIEISTLADYEMHSIYGDNTNDMLVAFLNAAEAIYLNQLGISFSIVKQTVFTSLNQPLRSTSPIDLLNDFAAYSNTTHQFGDADIYHLFTGKSFSGGSGVGQIVGLAYTGVLCRYQNEASYGLSRLYNEALAPLVAAHEIGHNLNATHDMNTSSLMSPFVSPSNSAFSAHSLNEINDHLSKYNSCLSQGNEVRPPQFDLETSLRGRKTLTLAVNASGENLDTCTVDVYGATTRGALDTDILEFADRIVSFNLDATGQVALRAKLSRALRKQGKIFFRASMTCTSNQIFSSIDPLKIRVSAAKSLSADKWLSYLSRQFARLIG